MNKSRRNFLKIAGIAALGVTADKFVDAHTQDTAKKVIKKT